MDQSKQVVLVVLKVAFGDDLRRFTLPRNAPQLYSLASLNQLLSQFFPRCLYTAQLRNGEEEGIYDDFSWRSVVEQACDGVDRVLIRLNACLLPSFSEKLDQQSVEKDIFVVEAKTEPPVAVAPPAPFPKLELVEVVEEVKSTEKDVQTEDVEAIRAQIADLSLRADALRTAVENDRPTLQKLEETLQTTRVNREFFVKRLNEENNRLKEQRKLVRQLHSELFAVRANEVKVVKEREILTKERRSRNKEVMQLNREIRTLSQELKKKEQQLQVKKEKEEIGLWVDEVRFPLVITQEHSLFSGASAPRPALVSKQEDCLCDSMIARVLADDERTAAAKELVIRETKQPAAAKQPVVIPSPSEGITFQKQRPVNKTVRPFVMPSHVPSHAVRKELARQQLIELGFPDDKRLRKLIRKHFKVPPFGEPNVDVQGVIDELLA